MAGDPRERLGVEASTVSHSGKEGMVTTSAGEAAPESFSRERPETSPGATSIGGPRAGAGAVGAGAAGAGEENVMLTELERKSRLPAVLLAPSRTLTAESPGVRELTESQPVVVHSDLQCV